MVYVELREGETIDEALRRFKRQCERSGILQEIRKREYHVTPSEKKKQRMNEAVRKLQRKIMKMQRNQSTDRKKRRPRKFFRRPAFGTTGTGGSTSGSGSMGPQGTR
ncbi:MAG: 30S ribosomal protein S21 [Elusimicrobiota bacterium]